METDNKNAGLVRLATENDIAEIAAIEQRCFSDPWSENAFRSCLNENTDLFVLEAEGSVCGYAVFDRTLGNEAELHNIAVAPEMRGRGLSRILMDALVASAKKNGVERVTKWMMLALLALLGVLAVRISRSCIRISLSAFESNASPRAVRTSASSISVSTSFFCSWRSPVCAW